MISKKGILVWEEKKELFQLFGGINIYMNISLEIFSPVSKW